MHNNMHFTQSLFPPKFSNELGTCYTLREKVRTGWRNQTIFPGYCWHLSDSASWL